MFRVINILFIMLVLVGYCASRIVTRWPAAQENIGLSVAAALAFFFIMMLGPFGDRLWFPRWKQAGWGKLVYWLDWVSYLFFGIMSIMLLYGFVADGITILYRLLTPATYDAQFDHIMLLTYAGATLFTTALGIWRVCAPVVVRVDVPLPGLPASFDGFTIAQVSDMHVGPTIKRRHTQRAVDMVNALKPDMVALTGDFIDGTVEDLKDDVAPLAGLQAKYGVFFVSGNHEYYWNAHAWAGEFERLGARVLVNRHERILHNGSEIVVAGVNDYASGEMDVAAALKGAPDGAIKILLAHQPATYKTAEPLGVHLMLSGHTHAGQYFPYTMLIRFFQRFYRGLNRVGGMLVYVNRGTGYWGPPLRAGAPSEITLLTLRRLAS